MANLNKVMLIGRLTRDPEAIEARGSTAGAKFGFAVNNRRLNSQTGQWEDVPVFLDVEIWNRGETNRQAERVLQNLRKGQQVFIEGHLKMDQWDDKNGGGKRSKIVVVVDNFQYLDPRQDSLGGGEMAERAPAPRQYSRAAAPAGGRGGSSSYGRGNSSYAAGSEDDYDGPPQGGLSSRGGMSPSADDDIPF